MNAYDIISDGQYIINGETLRLMFQLLEIYESPCIINERGNISRLDYSNEIYGLLGQLYQEFAHSTPVPIKVESDN